MTKQDTHNIACGVNADGPIIGRLMKFHVIPTMQADLQEALNQYVFSALEAEGNIMAEACYQEDDASILWIIERWATTASLDANDKRQPMLRIISLRRVGRTAQAEDVYFMDIDGLPHHAYQQVPKEGDDSYTVMFFTDTIGGTEQYLKSIYHSSMPAFRSDPGVLVYQLSQDLIDDSKFITYKKFRSRQAFEQHLSSPLVGPLVDFLQTPARNPTFEKGFYTLIEFAPLLRARQSQMNMGSAGIMK